MLALLVHAVTHQCYFYVGGHGNMVLTGIWLRLYETCMQYQKTQNVGK